MRFRIAFIFFLFSLVSYGQKEAYNWLFGEKVGLRFYENSGPAVLFGELNTFEGCSSISDNLGNLLFYSDGSNVWSRNDQLMPNGTGLLGDESSTQSAIIIPKPKNPNIYYLFTVGSTISPSGFHYYTVDMSLNGGMGDVSDGPVNLTDGHAGNEWSEKITAVQGAECNTFWVISLVKDLFYAYKVDENGVNQSPVISKVAFESSRSRGYLKVSPDGQKLAAAHQGADSPFHGAFLYDFNNQTGEVTDNDVNLFPNQIVQAYGVEFSAQTTKLYISTIKDTSYKLYQFDLNASNIANSAQVIHEEEDAFRGALQLGPDHKIYATIPVEYTVGTRYLDVINNPELLGNACGFQQDYINLGNGNFAMQGLPPFIQSFFYVSEINIVNSNVPVSLDSKKLLLCKGDNYTLRGRDIDGADYFWTFNDGQFETPIPTPSPPHMLTINNSGVNIEGVYKLTIQTNDDCNSLMIGEANLTFTDPPNFNPYVSLSKCDLFDDNPYDGLTTFDLSNSLIEITNGRPTNYDVFFYLNDEDAERDTTTLDALPYVYTNSTNHQTLTTKVYKKETSCYRLGKLELNVSDGGGRLLADDVYVCYSGDELNTYDLDQKLNDIIIENGLPNNANVVFFETLEDAIGEQNPVGGSSFESVEDNTIYFKVQDNNLCNASGVFNLKVIPPPPIDSVEETIELCFSSFPMALDSSIPNESKDNYSYVWSTGERSDSIIVNDGQSVTVTVHDKSTSCEISKTYNIIELPPPRISSAEVNINNNTVAVYIEDGDGETLYALNDPNGIYQTNNLFTNVPSGVHTVYAKNSCGITEKKVYLLGFPKFFTPNNDAANDYWFVKGLNVEEFSISSIKVFDRYGKLLKTLHPNDKWDGTFNGELLPSTDYWFVITIKDENDLVKTYKGHFSLTR